MAAFERVCTNCNPERFAELFAPDGQYHYPPFQAQKGRAELIAPWDRILFEEDMRMSVKVLAETETGGIGHWNVD